MNRIAQLFKGSIINKVILLIVLILISVGGILTVNTISFFDVKDSLESMIDRDVGQVIENTRISNNFRNSIALSDLLINTFTERENTLEEEKDRLIDKIEADMRSLRLAQRTSKKILKEYTKKLDKLFDQCAIINGILKEINTIEKSLDTELANLDEIVVEKELTIAVEDSEEALSLKQLAIMLPGYREIFFEIIAEFTGAKNAYLGTKEIKHNHEQKILSLLEEFDIGLHAMPIAWKEIIPYVRNMKEMTSRYKFQIVKVFKIMREFHDHLGVLKLSQKQVMAETSVINNQIIKNTHAIRRKTSENITSSIKTTVLLSSLIILILFVIGVFTVRLVQPIKRLSIGAGKIGAGDLNFKVKIDLNDEIGHLAESFNRMTYNLRKTTVSKEHVQNILKSMNEALIVLTPEGNIQTVNQATCDLFGYKAEELVGEPVGKIFGENEGRNTTKKKLNHKSEIENIIQQRFIKNKEETFKCKDGSEIPVLFSASAMLDKDKSIQGIVCVASDITDLKNAESDLRDSEKKYRTLVEHSLQGILIIQKNRIVYTNKAFADITGYTIEELYSFTPEKVIALIHPDDQRLVWGRLKERSAGKTVPQQYEFRGISKDGSERSLEMYASLIALNGLPAVQGTILDVTERQLAEEALRSSLKEKEVLLREIHHRVKNNMQVITSLLRLQSTKINEKQYAELLKDSQSRIKSMALVHEKLYQSKDFAEIDFNSYVKSLVNSLFRSYGINPAKIAIRVEVDDVSLELGSAIPCGLIINELVSNALKYAFPEDREGEIRVALGSTKEDELKLTVSDNGAGMPEHIDFRNTESLGLHMVAILAEDQLQGKIELNRVGGTKYDIKFKKARKK